MTEQKRAATVAFGWRSLAVSVVTVVAAIALALLLIPQLSLPAAIRGGTITLGALIGVRVATWVYHRLKTRA